MPIDPQKFKKFQKGFNKALGGDPDSGSDPTSPPPDQSNSDGSSGQSQAAALLGPDQTDPVQTASDLLTDKDKKNKKGSDIA